MKRMIYTLTLSAAMLGASALVMADSGKGDRHNEKQCEAKFEAAKEACELQAGDVQKCKAHVEELAKQACQETEPQNRERDRDHR